VVASFAGSADYAAAQSQPVTFTIAQASLTIAADNKVQSLGAPLPTLTCTSTGFVNGDSLTTQPTLSTSATTGSAVGTYPITISGGTASPNYKVTLVNGTLTVAADATVVSVSDAGGTYNGLAFAATATVASANGTAGSSLEGVSPTLLYYVGSDTSGTGSASAPVNAGTYTVVASFAGSADYAPAQSQPVTFTITTVTPTVSVSDAGGTYNGSSFAATATVAGVNGISGSSLEGVSPTLLYYVGGDTSGTGSASAPVNAGTYTVVASFAGSADYTPATSSPQTFTITYWVATAAPATPPAISSRPVVTVAMTARTVARGITWIVATPAPATMTVWYGGGRKRPDNVPPVKTERLGQEETHFRLPADLAGELVKNAELVVQDLQLDEASMVPVSETETGDLPPPAPRAPSPPAELTTALLPPQKPKADVPSEQPMTWSNLLRWASVLTGASAVVLLLYTGRDWVWQRYRGRRAAGNNGERRLLYTSRYRLWPRYRGRQATGNNGKRRFALRRTLQKALRWGDHR
jgi:hypothetical protein